MKFNKWIILLLLNVLCFSANSQELSFPVTGSFELQIDENSRPMDFNKVVIESNSFTLWMNNQALRSYSIVSEIKGGFAVEQIVAGNAWSEKFNVTINEITAEACSFSIHYEEGSETISLQRIE